MIVKTGRFGQLTISDSEVVRIAQGILGFPDSTEFCIVDPGDDTLILWLQALNNPEVVFPILEPKVFLPHYSITLSALDQRELGLKNLQYAAVFSILTIPEDVTTMMANVKAPLVINLREQIGKQVVLQESEFSIRHPMFKELRAHLMTIQANRGGDAGVMPKIGTVQVRELPLSSSIRSLALVQ